MAARYLSARLMGARIEAVTRSASVGLRFEAAGSDYSYAAFRDGNGNGARAADVSAGIDSRLTAPETLGDRIAGVQFGLLAGVPDVDGDPNTGSEPFAPCDLSWRLTDACRVPARPSVRPFLEIILRVGLRGQGCRMRVRGVSRDGQRDRPK
jgi:hypothetical protein